MRWPRERPPTSSPPSTSRAKTTCGWSSRAAATATRARRTRADSLLIWTRAMNAITLHDAFVAAGCAGKPAPQPAVTRRGGRASGCAAYHAVDDRRPAATCRAAAARRSASPASIQSGGFGSFSKHFGIGGGGAARSRGRHRRRRGPHRQRLHESRPVLGAEGRRRRQLRRRHAAHAAHARAARILRRRRR